MERYYIERKEPSGEWAPVFSGSSDKEDCLRELGKVRHYLPYEEFRAVEVVDVKVIG